jgi:hypothetical protein
VRVCCEPQDALKINKFSFTVESGVEEVRAALGGLDGGVGDKVNAILAAPGRLELIVEELVARAKVKEEKAVRAKARAYEDFADHLRAMRGLEAELTWEQVHTHSHILCACMSVCWGTSGVVSKKYPLWLSVCCR